MRWLKVDVSISEVGIDMEEVEVGKVDDEIGEKHGLTGGTGEEVGVDKVDDKIGEIHDEVGERVSEVYVEVEVVGAVFSVKLQNLLISCPGVDSDTA